MIPAESQCTRCGTTLSQKRVGGNCPSCLYASVVGLAAVGEDSEAPSFDSMVDLSSDFEIEKEIGRGGVSVVYRAWQKSVGRTVALKTLLASSLNHEETFHRFQIEAEAVGCLEHPHVVPLYGVGLHLGVPFIAFRIFERGSLAEDLRKHRYTPRESVRLIAVAASAVHFAHQHGILHRDIKPSNILLDDEGKPHIADFGLAKLANDSRHLTLTTSVLGTPSYMAPEQAGGKVQEVGTPADIYSLGAVLFELLTGRPPFVGATPLEVLRLAADAHPPRPSVLNPAVDNDLEAICLHCLEREPGHRYSSAAALAADLEAWLCDESLLVRPPTGGERVFKWLRRRPLVAALVAGIVAVLFTGIGATLWQWRKAVVAREAALAESYASNLKAVTQALDQGRLAEARSRLLAEPERFRGWEWGRLMKLAHPEVFTATLPSPSNHFIGPFDEIDHRISPDGNLIAANLPGQPVHVYKTRSPSWRKVLGTIEEPATSGQFSSDGRLLATIGPGPGFVLWNTDSWSEALHLGTNGQPDRMLTFQPLGNWIATCASGQPVQLWDRRDGTLRVEFKAHETNAGPIVGFSRDGQRLVRYPNPLEVGSRLTIWDMETLKPMGAFPAEPRRYTFIDVSPDARRMVTIDTNGVGEAWIVGADKPYFKTAAEGPNTVWSAHLSERYDRLAVLREPGQLRLWDTRSNRLLSSDPARVTRLHDVSPDRFITGNGERFVRVIDWDRGVELHRLAADGIDLGKQARLSADGFIVSATSMDAFGNHAVHAWTLPSQDRRFTSPRSIYTARSSPDGHLTALGSFGPELTLWDTNADRRMAFLKGHWRWVSALAWSPGGERLYSASFDHTLRIWRIPEGILEQTLYPHQEPIERLIVSRDGRKLASVDYGGMVVVSDAPSGKPLSSWRIQKGFFCFIAFSPDGRHLATSGGDSGKGVWDTETGARISPLEPEQGVASKAVLSVTFRPDGKQLATLEEDTQLRFWDTATWKVVRATRAISRAHAMQYSQDGSRLFVLASDNTMSGAGTSSLCVYDPKTAQLLATMDSRLGSSLDFSYSDAAQRVLMTVVGPIQRDSGVAILESLPWTRPGSGAAGTVEAGYYSELARVRHWSSCDNARTAQPSAVDLPWIEPRTNWIARLPGTPERCLDLSNFYNGHLETGWQPIQITNYSQDDLRQLPRGQTTLVGVPWDIRGVVTLGRIETSPAEVWPAGDRIEGIPVGMKCRRLHFLHALAHYSKEEGSVGRYRLNYTDGTHQDLVLRPKLDVGQWWTSSPGSRADEGEVAWEGDSPIAKQLNSRIRLFHRAWNNPHPQKEIVSFDFISDHTRAVPFLVAVTVDP